LRKIGKNIRPNFKYFKRVMMATETDARAIVILNRTVRSDWVDSGDVAATEIAALREVVLRLQETVVLQQGQMQTLLQKMESLERKNESLEKRVGELEADMKAAEEIFQSQEDLGLLKRV
jgi:hypothetical protein